MSPAIRSTVMRITRPAGSGGRRRAKGARKKCDVHHTPRRGDCHVRSRPKALAAHFLMCESSAVVGRP